MEAMMKANVHAKGSKSILMQLKDIWLLVSWRLPIQVLYIIFL